MRHSRVNTCRHAGVGQAAVVLRTSAAIVVVAGAGLAPAALEHSLESYIGHALRHNPAIAAQRSRLSAAGHDVRARAPIPDPRFSAGYFVSEVETRAGPQRARFGVSQAIPWPGTQANRRAVAAEDVDIAREALRQTRSRVIGELRVAYADLYAAGHTLRALEESLELLRQVEAVVSVHYTTGGAAQAALLRVQVESARLEDRIASVRADAAVHRSRIAALLDIGVASDIPFPDSMSMLAVPDALPAVREMVLRRGPSVRRREEELEKARESVGLARNESYGPRMSLMTDYIVTDEPGPSMPPSDVHGKDAWVVGVGVTVPLWMGSKRGRVGAARDRELAAQAILLTERNSATAQAAALYEEHGDALRRIELLRTVLTPKAEQAMHLTDEAYRNAQVGIVDLLDAQRMLLDLRIELARQQAQRERAAARLDALAGGALSGVDLMGTGNQ